MINEDQACNIVIDRLPLTVWGPCPCGCKKSWLEVTRSGQETRDEHFNRAIKQVMEEYDESHL